MNAYHILLGIFFANCTISSLAIVCNSSVDRLEKARDRIVGVSMVIMIVLFSLYLRLKNFHVEQ